MAASKLQTHISRLVHKIVTNFRRLCHVFGVQLSNKHSGNVVRSNGKKPEVEITRWRPLKFKYLYVSLYTRYSNEISTALPIFSGSRYPMRIVATISDQAGENQKWESKMAACKCKMLISQLVHNWTQDSKDPCFRGQATRRDKWDYCANIKRWRPLTGSRYDITYVSAFIYTTKLQRLYPCFWGRAARLD